MGEGGRVEGEGSDTNPLPFELVDEPLFEPSLLPPRVKKYRRGRLDIKYTGWGNVGHRIMSL